MRELTRFHYSDVMTQVPPPEEGQYPANPQAVGAPALVAPPANVAPTRSANYFGLAALIVGILALMGSAIPFVNIVSGVFAVVGLILGIIGLTRKNAKKGTSIAGTIISAVALIMAVVFGILYAVLFVAIPNAVNNKPTDDTTLVAPSQQPTQAPPSNDLGSLTNPAPLGTIVELSLDNVVLWEVSLDTVVLDGSAQVMAEDPTAPAPPAGMQYAVVNARFTNVGPSEGDPWSSVDLSFLTPDGTRLNETDTTVKAPAPSALGIGVMQPKSSIAGNLVVLIPSAAAAEGLWSIALSGSGVRFYFASK